MFLFLSFLQGDRETGCKSNGYVGTPNTHDETKRTVAGLSEALWLIYIIPAKVQPCIEIINGIIIEMISEITIEIIIEVLY